MKIVVAVLATAISSSAFAGDWTICELPWNRNLALCKRIQDEKDKCPSGIFENRICLTPEQGASLRENERLKAEQEQLERRRQEARERALKPAHPEISGAWRDNKDKCDYIAIMSSDTSIKGTCMKDGALFYEFRLNWISEKLAEGTMHTQELKSDCSVTTIARISIENESKIKFYHGSLKGCGFNYNSDPDKVAQIWYRK